MQIFQVTLTDEAQMTANTIGSPVLNFESVRPWDGSVEMFYLSPYQGYAPIASYAYLMKAFVGKTSASSHRPT